MYAVIFTGGTQYRVEKDLVLKIAKLQNEVGEAIEFDKVLLVGEGEDVKIGAPYVENVKVKAEVTAHGRGKKVEILKFRRRKHHMKRQGHRQDYTEVKITDIEAA